MKHLLPAIILAGASCVAFAEETTFDSTNDAYPKTYAGANIGFFEYEEDGLSDLWEPSFATAGIKVGASFNQYIDGEIRFLRGLLADDIVLQGVLFEMDLDYIAGAYLKVGAGEVLHPYALVGYSKSKLTLTGSQGGSTRSTTDSESDVSFGLGVDLWLKNQLGFNLECVSYYDKDDASISGCAVGAALRF